MPYILIPLMMVIGIAIASQQSGNRSAEAKYYQIVQYFTRRAYKKHTLGNSCAEGAELFGALEEVNHFAELFLFLICACDLFKGRL